MQNYYRVLGVGPLATAVEIEQAYARQRARFKRLAAADRAMKARLSAVETGFDILGNPRRRLAYDLLLAQEPPEARAPRYSWRQEQLVRYARVARRLNAALLACFLLLALDWALPARDTPTKPCAPACPCPFPRRSPTLSLRTGCTPSTPHFACPVPSATACARATASQCGKHPCWG
jgi:hypothetical protein